MSMEISPQLKLANGALFPLYLNSALIGKVRQAENQITKQRIVEIIKNSKEIYVSEISGILCLPIQSTIEFVSELKSEGKIKTIL